jgi:hypothetical protein
VEPGGGGTADTRLLDLQVDLEPPHAPLRLRILLAENSPVEVVLLPAESDWKTVARSLAPMVARERQRTERSAKGGVEIRLEGGGEGSVDSFDEALLVLEEIAPPITFAGELPPPFLAGVSEGIPTYLTGPALAEVGTAALAAGRFSLARSILEALAGEPKTRGGAAEQLTSQWAEWTGRATPAGWLSPADAGRVLPMAGARSLRHESAPAPAPSVQLPPPESFGNPNSAAFASRRTLHSARLVRAWIEGTLGLRPDAAAGRLRIAPEIRPEWEFLRVSGIRMGDAIVDFEYRRESRKATFVLRQEEGRVPIQLIFEPLLPVTRVAEVRIADSIAEVEQTEEALGIRLRCQFPLDPERRVTVVG